MKPFQFAIGRLAVLGLLTSAACAPTVTSTPTPTPASGGLPPIPTVEGPLDIRVVHPTPGTPRPSVDSTFVYGSVGNGRASLSINGTTVDVAPNGAFLAFLPVPPDGTYQLTARAGGTAASATRSYRAPPTASAPASTSAAPAPAPQLVEFPEPRTAVVTGGADTLRTGSDVAIGRPTPTGTFRWFLPRGARLTLTAQQGDLLRARLDSATTAWFRAGDLQMDAAAGARASPPRARVRPGGVETVDVEITADGAPFLVETRERGLTLTLYGVEPGAWEPAGDGSPLISQARWSAAANGASRLELELARPLWGYQAFYEPDGRLVLRLRRPPDINPMHPLRGMRIVVDPGHPPAGATGPTGLTEAEANLAIGLKLAELLRARGAEVIMTRTTGAPLLSATDASAELRARTLLAVRENAHVLLSVHNNAFAEGVNPFRNHGTSTYYFHPFAADLARALNQEMVQTTRIPDLGARTGNLALVRPTWMPAVLTESLFMMIPEQEAALRDPAFVERLAAAHVRGLERFLRERATR